MPGLEPLPLPPHPPPEPPPEYPPLPELPVPVPVVAATEGVEDEDEDEDVKCLYRKYTTTPPAVAKAQTGMPCHSLVSPCPFLAGGALRAGVGVAIS